MSVTPTDASHDVPPSSQTVPPEASSGGVFGETLAPSLSDVPFVAKNPVVPGYEIVRELGRGGMGVVYLARQHGLKRLVALKMILSGVHASKETLDRFRLEAESLALLHHPHIVQVFEVGEHEGRPFFSAEYCTGGGLDRRLKESPLQPKDAAALVEKLAQGMEAAHQKGVIHRDLKPANVLLAGEEEATSAVVDPSRLVPKISDFGLAKKLDDVGQTQSGAIMGTPSYMSPEQAAGRSSEVGTRSDVYALGAILYECLIGRPPFRAATLADTLQQVLYEEAVSLSQLNARVPRDLDTICLKCLRKEPSRRYSTAAALAEDLRRFRVGEPITARPVGNWERGWRWCRRNPAVASLTAVAVLLLVLGTTISLSFAFLAEDRASRLQQSLSKEEAARKAEVIERGKAEKALREVSEQKILVEQEKARVQEELDRRNFAVYALRLREAKSEIERGRTEQARTILAECNSKLVGWEHDFLQRLATRERRTYEGHDEALLCTAFSPDGFSVVSGSKDNTLKVWNVLSARERFTLKGHRDWVTCVAYSPGSNLIVSGSNDRTVKMWDAKKGTLLKTYEGHEKVVNSVSISIDGKLIASGSDDNSIKVWDVTTGAEIRTLKGHTSKVSSVAFHTDCVHLVSGSWDKTLKVWDTKTGEEIRTFEGHDNAVDCVAFSRTPPRIASGSLNGVVKIWDADTGAEVRTIKAHPAYVKSVVFTRDGSKLLTGGGGQKVVLWDVTTGTELMVLNATGHGNAVEEAALSPDEKRVASAHHDTVLRYWDLTTQDVALSIKAHSDDVLCLAFRPDGKNLVSGSRDQTLTEWDAVTGQEVMTLFGHTGSVTCVAYRADGRQIVSGSTDKTVRVWDAEKGQSLYALNGHRLPVQSVAISPDGKWIASASQDETVIVWDTTTRKAVHILKGHKNSITAVTFRPDGKHLLSASEDKNIKVWDVAEGKEIGQLAGHDDWVLTVSYNRDGTRIVSGGSDKRLKLWDADSGKVLLTFEGHAESVTSAVFSRDGRRIFSGGGDRSIKVWDTVTGQEALSLATRPEPITAVVMSPDGKRLVTSCRDKTIEVWDATRKEARASVKKGDLDINKKEQEEEDKNVQKGDKRFPKNLIGD